MNYRQKAINGALGYVEQARLYLANNQPKLADQVLTYALEDFRRALDIGPSEEAIKEIIGEEAA